MIGLYALILGLVLLVLVVGIEYGRAEAAAHYLRIIEEQQDTIDALLPPRVTIVP